LTFDASETLLAEVLAARDRGGLRCPTKRRGTVPGTTTTIDKEQRDGLYELVRNHLGGIGDIWIALEQDGEYMLAERMGSSSAKTSACLPTLAGSPRTNANRSS
jgi:hypothetical protein